MKFILRIENIAVRKIEGVYISKYPVRTRREFYCRSYETVPVGINHPETTNRRRKSAS